MNVKRQRKGGRGRPREYQAITNGQAEILDFIDLMKGSRSRVSNVADEFIRGCGSGQRKFDDAVAHAVPQRARVGRSEMINVGIAEAGTRALNRPVDRVAVRGVVSGGNGEVRQGHGVRESHRHPDWSPVSRVV